MATKKWVLDPSHSEVNFRVKHLMITNVTGTFGSFNVEAETEGEDFSNAKVNFSADINSITTGSEQRDGHLKSPDFFDAANFDKLSFTSTGTEGSSANGEFVLNGNLTIKGVTKPVKLNVEYGGLMKDPWGNLKAGFTVNGKINRNDWGLSWNAPLEAGGVLVSEDVRLTAEIQLTEQA